MSQRLPLALTMGEPAGIGGDITLKAWANKRKSSVPPFFVIDDPERLRALSRLLNIDIPIKEIKSAESADKAFSEALPVLAIGIKVKSKPGKPSSANNKAVIRSIEIATDLAMHGRAGAVVTNPINKAVLIEGGFKFPGHTEFLAHLAKSVQSPVMMLTSPQLRVALATIHVSIKNAVEQLSVESIVHVGKICHHSMINDFAIDNPIIAVAGLNPHAGEGGIMGTEEIKIITPAINVLRDIGINVVGPLPPDTMFSERERKKYDVALCMYHDQGLIPLKTIGFDQGINITLGLPFIRTSPDHGTAFDIAGSGSASEESLVNALKTAAQMQLNRSTKD